jgi:hypothetical protein
MMHKVFQIKYILWIKSQAHVFHSMARGRGSYNNLRMLWLASNQGKQTKVFKLKCRDVVEPISSISLSSSFLKVKLNQIKYARNNKIYENNKTIKLVWGKALVFKQNHQISLAFEHFA